MLVVRRRVCEFSQVIDFSPVARCDAGAFFFPWLRGVGVVFAFRVAPIEIAHMEFGGGFAPVGAALEQRAEAFDLVRVVDAVAPEVTEVTGDDFSAVEKERMIVGGSGGEDGFGGQGLHSDGHAVDFGALGEFVAFVAAVDAAKKRDEAGEKKRHARHCTNPNCTPGIAPVS